MATPSGSMPTIRVATTLRWSIRVMLAVPASSLEAKRVLPSGLTANCSGSLPTAWRARIFLPLGSKATTASAALWVRVAVSLSAT